MDGFTKFYPYKLGIFLFLGFSLANQVANLIVKHRAKFLVSSIEYLSLILGSSFFISI